MIKLPVYSVLARLCTLEPPKSYTPKPGSPAEERKRRPIADFLGVVDMSVRDWDWLQEQTKKMHPIIKRQVFIAVAERAMKEDPGAYAKIMNGGMQ